MFRLLVFSLWLLLLKETDEENIIINLASPIWYNGSLSLQMEFYISFLFFPLTVNRTVHRVVLLPAAVWDFKSATADEKRWVGGRRTNGLTDWLTLNRNESSRASKRNNNIDLEGKTKGNYYFIGFLMKRKMFIKRVEII